MPLSILYGPDSFSRAEALGRLKASLDSDGMLGTNTNVFDARSLTPGQLQMTCDAAPFLASNRLVVVEGLLGRLTGVGRAGGRGGRGRRSGASALPEEWQALPETVARMPPTTMLVLVDGDLPAEAPALVALTEHGRSRNFPRLPARAIEGWIAARAKAAGVTLQADALALFAGSVSQEAAEDGQWHALWAVASDLEKLSLFAAGRPVGADDVRRLVPAAGDTNVFAWVDAVVERRGHEALRRLADLLAAGQPPPVLLTMLVRGYRQLALYADLAGAGARPEEIGRRLNFQRWQLDRVSRQAAHYRLPALAAIYARMLDADRTVKRGEADDVTAIELLTAELAAAS